MEETTIDTVDWISQLPDFIIHHVLSFLSDDSKTLVRVSVLSKNWYSLTASLPILKFDWLHLGDNLFKYVKYTTSRLNEQKFSPHTFDICARIREPTHRDIIDKCVGFVLQKGVQVLVLNVYRCKGQQMYRLPSQRLYASSLLSLTIHSCELPSSLMFDTFTIPSLKILSLEQVPIYNDEVITYLTANCPVLEDLELEFCYGFKRICVNAHQTLQKVQIGCSGPIDKIDIQAPNISYLLVDASAWEPTCMNLASCEKIKTFCYYGDQSEPHFLPSFRCIQNLLLYSRSEKWRLSVPSLRSLALQSDCDLDEIDIYAPNLHLFEYSGYCNFYGQKRLSTPFKKEDSAHATAFMGDFESFLYVDSIWFKKLRFFLGKYQGIEVLKLRIGVNEEGINAYQLMEIKSQPYDLKHLQVEFCDLQDFEDVVDALLWCCRPLSLTLRLEGIWLKNRRLYRLKHPYEKLLKQEDRGQFKIRFVLTQGLEAKQQFTDLNLLAEALHCDTYPNTITFIKEKVVE
uniref:putative F-box/LRR-repeat protein At5g02930 n=1 Tax=Erigeron canadensis TaxID=72917 RepID=UPI001CB91BE7|nr:putative F-box/LRR-repeat protein At5g02930 [Erigeron canadensis]